MGKITLERGGDLRRFDPTQPPFYCGSALQARPLSGCLLSPRGEVLGHRNMPTAPETCLHVVAPYRQGLVVAGACRGTWDGLAALWADAGLPWVLGQALDRQAIQGGQAQTAPMASPKLAALLRGGRLPQAAGSPARLRAPRALRRRRLPLAPHRAELLAHGQTTNRQAHLPAIGTKSADKATREGGAERGADPAVQKRLAVELALLPYAAACLRVVALPSVPTARPPDATPRHLGPTVPGIGTMRRRGLRYAIPAGHRCPRGQDVVSQGRLGPWAREAAGQRFGTAGTQLGTAPLKGAVAAAAVWGLSAPPAAPPDLARWEKKPAPGTARPLRAPPWARAVYPRRTRQVACDRARGCPRSGRGAAEPGASLAPPGMPLHKARAWAVGPASVHATAPRRSRSPAPCALMGPPRSLRLVAVLVVHGLRGLLLTRAWGSLDHATP